MLSVVARSLRRAGRQFEVCRRRLGFIPIYLTSGIGSKLQGGFRPAPQKEITNFDEWNVARNQAANVVANRSDDFQGIGNIVD